MLKFLHGLCASGELMIPLEEHAYNESQLVDALTAFKRQWRCEEIRPFAAGIVHIIPWYTGEISIAR